VDSAGSALLTNTSIFSILHIEETNYLIKPVLRVTTTNGFYKERIYIRAAPLTSGTKSQILEADIFVCKKNELVQKIDHQIFNSKFDVKEK